MAKHTANHATGSELHLQILRHLLNRILFVSPKQIRLVQFIEAQFPYGYLVDRKMNHHRNRKFFGVLGR